MKTGKFEIKEGLLYNDDYSWMKIEGNIATIGVNDIGAKLANEFVFIRLPEKGKEIKKGEVYVSLEAVKWSGHLTSPVSGKIVDVNERVFDEPALINRVPYSNWIMKVELENKEEVKELMSAGQFAEWVKKKHSA